MQRVRLKKYIGQCRVPGKPSHGTLPSQNLPWKPGRQLHLYFSGNGRSSHVAPFSHLCAAHSAPPVNQNNIYLSIITTLQLHLLIKISTCQSNSTAQPANYKNIIALPVNQNNIHLSIITIFKPTTA